ncbi:hypothetical protein KSC_016400 [Ktedonobacter sp. SOSP1-52]|nr:hypothetical protein KSC_016400 [Ktedonobacter sp. SOSP1-52]
MHQDDECHSAQGGEANDEQTKGDKQDKHISAVIGCERRVSSMPILTICNCPYKASKSKSHWE